MRRRSFLAVSSALAAAAVAVVSPLGRPVRGRASRVLSDILVPPLDTSPGTAPLEVGTERVLLALGEVLSPPGTPRATCDGFYRRHVRARAQQDAGFHREYALGAELMQQTTRRRFGESGDFSALEPDERNLVLTDLLGDAGRPSRWELGLSYISPRGRRVNRFRRFVFLDLLKACYASDLGWTVVGYDAPPGVCGDLEEYQHPGKPIGVEGDA